MTQAPMTQAPMTQAPMTQAPMTQGQATDPVRRKIRAAAAGAPGALDDRLQRLWRQAAARALKAAVGLNASVTEAAAATVAADDLAALPEAGEMALLVENEEGDVGLALVDPGLLAALVEMQTIGRVTERAPQDRTATAIDGALVGPVLDRLLSVAGAGLEAAGLADAAAGYRFATLADPGAPPTLALADAPHRCLTLALKLAGGAKQGRLRLAVPVAPSGGAPGAGAADWGARIAETVLSTDLVLEARMGRIRLPVEAVMQLAVGDVLPFSQEDLHRVRLVAGPGAQVVAEARLGKSAGVRAVKLTRPAEGGAAPWAPAAPQASGDGA
jgi:flagellar motor switch protein FliM